MQNGVERMNVTWSSTLLRKKYREEDLGIVYEVISHALPAYPVKLAYKTDIIITTLHVRKLRHKLNYPLITYLQLGKAKTRIQGSTPTELYCHVVSFLMLRVAP